MSIASKIRRTPLGRTAGFLVHRRSITVVSAVGAVVVLLAASPAVAAGTWTVTPTQSVGTASSFADLDFSSATDGWAVGNGATAGGAGDGMIERWNGTRWAVTPSPSILVPGNSYAGLTGVDALSPDAAFAVGFSNNYADDGLLHTAAVALRWNGTAWSRLPMPASGATVDSLTSVKAFSATDVWAVGRTVADVDGRTLIMHWDGTAWSRIPSPSPSTRDNLLMSINGSSATDVWAVGYYRDPPYGNTAQHSLVLHWNGTAWSRTPSPDVGTVQTRLRDVAPLSATDAWAVGSTNVNSVAANDSSAVLHWNGTAWSKVTAPALASLWSVTALSPTDIWVTGSTAAGVPQLAIWQGSSWTITPVPGLPSTGGPSLMGTTALAPGTVWGVGQVTGADGITRPLAVRTTNG